MAVFLDGSFTESTAKIFDPEVEGGGFSIFIHGVTTRLG